MNLKSFERIDNMFKGGFKDLQTHLKNTKIDIFETPLKAFYDVVQRPLNNAMNSYVLQAFL